MPSGVFPIAPHFHLCIENDLGGGASISTGRIVKTSLRRAVACKVSGVKGGVK